MIDRGEELVRVAVSAAGHFLDQLIEGLAEPRPKMPDNYAPATGIQAPVRKRWYTLTPCGGVAQWLERRSHNP